MSERTRKQDPLERLPGGGGGFDDSFTAPATGLVGVSHGPFNERLPVAGMTVGTVRARFGDRFAIDPESHPVIDGHPTTEDTVLRVGQLLAFRRASGEKGVGT